MSKHHLEFDPKNISFKKASIQTWKIIRYLLMMLFISLTLSIALYFFTSLIFSTEEEKLLYRENKMYEKIYPTLSPKEKLLEDVIAGLQYKDSRIYENIFSSNAPNVDPMSRLGFLFASDTIPDTQLMSYTTEKALELLDKSKAVDAAFEQIFASLADSAFVCPPMRMPLEDISYAQIGASVGSKMSPFLKAFVFHDGLDFIVLRGTDVFATADGVVSEIGNNKSEGRYVEISHQGGYTTRYCHLEDIQVRRGQIVAKASKIGSAGMSGNSFAPHLHYEISRWGETLDPINYLFASIGPSDYANMLYMATNTVQSMD